jgi:hypothetical protein
MLPFGDHSLLLPSESQPYSRPDENVKRVVSSMNGNAYPQEIENAFLGSDGVICKRGVDIYQYRSDLDGILVLDRRIVCLYIFAVLPFSTSVLREKCLCYTGQIGLCIRCLDVVRPQAG